MGHNSSEVLSCCWEHHFTQSSLMNITYKVLSWFIPHCFCFLMKTKHYHSSVECGYPTGSCRRLNHRIQISILPQGFSPTSFDIISEAMAAGLNISLYNL